MSVCAVALLSACVAVSALASDPAGSGAAASAKPKKGKGAKKGCKKGFKKQTVIKKGKKVKVCKKVKGKQAPAEGGGGGGGAGGPASLFEAPGKQLTGEAARRRSRSCRSTWRTRAGPPAPPAGPSARARSRNATHTTPTAPSTTAASLRSRAPTSWSASSPIQKLGPFQYVAGPRTCSY